MTDGRTRLDTSREGDRRLPGGAQLRNLFLEDSFTGSRVDDRRSTGDAPIPPAPAIDKPLDWKSEGANKHTADIDHSKQFGFKLKLTSTDPSKPEALTRVETQYPGDTHPTRVYEKQDGKWYQILEGGKKIEMQGELRADTKTGEFTQVLRRDLNGNKEKDGVRETTRTMSADGTETIHRMDGSESIFKHKENGDPKEWVEVDKAGNRKVFTPTGSKFEGQVEWVSADGKEKRYDPRIDDNGNVSWADKPKVKPGEKGSETVQARHYETSAGDHVVDGAGVHYDFNQRGDITQIRYDKARDFEGYKVDRIDIRYRGDSPIIDGLTMSLNGHQVGRRERFQTNNPAEVSNNWAVYDQYNRAIVQTTKLADGRIAYVTNAQGQQLFAPAIGDYSIADGQISTTEPNYLHRKVDGKEPAMVKVTYADAPSTVTDGSGTHTTSELKLKVEEVKDLDIKVAGETGFIAPSNSGNPTDVPQSPTARSADIARYIEEHYPGGMDAFREHLRQLAAKKAQKAADDEAEKPEPGWDPSFI